MMPLMKLNTAPVTSSQPPHSIAAALTRSVRALRRLIHSNATSAISAAGSSQLIWPPNSLLNSLITLAGPPQIAPPPPPAAPPADRAGLVPGQPAEAVIAERELQHAVVGRPADVGPVGGGGELHDRDPPAGRGHQ